MNRIILRGLAKSDFIPSELKYKGCMCYLCFNPVAYRHKQSNEGGRFIFVSDSDSLCQVHYDSLKDELER